jgi:hypothetical protein
MWRILQEMHRQHIVQNPFKGGLVHIADQYLSAALDWQGKSAGAKSPDFVGPQRPD